MNKTSMITIRVNEQDKKEFEDLAKKYNLNVSALLRFLVRKEMKNYEG